MDIYWHTRHPPGYIRDTRFVSATAGHSLKGKFVLTAGLGGMGGAQPLAITMNEGVGLIVEADPERARRRLEIGYVDTVVDTLEEAMTLVEEAQENEEPKSIGLIGNAADIYPELALRGVTPDVVTDQTPAHDVHMYIPSGLSVAEAESLRRNDPDEYTKRSMKSMARHVGGCKCVNKIGTSRKLIWLATRISGP